MTMMPLRVPEAFSGLLEPRRYKIYYGGRGGAKSGTFGRVLVALGAQRPLRVLCAREFQASIADSVHKLLSDAIAELGLGNFYTVTQNSIYAPNGTEFIFRGLRGATVESLKSLEGIDIAWIEEAQTISDSSLDVLVPTIRKEGSEIWMSFNPRFRTDAVWQRFIKRPPSADRALIRKVTWRDNPFISQVLLDEKDDLKETDHDRYLHVWEGELAAFQEGSIYADQIKKARADGRICQLPIESGVPVHTFWDLGKNDHTAIWFMQEVGPWLHFVDYFQDRQKDLEHYAHVLQARGYLYGEHYMPHDGAHERLGMPKAIYLQLEDLGVKPTRLVPRIPDVQRGINMARHMFSKVRIDEDRCEDGLDCLIEYRYKMDPLRGTSMNVPLHSWASNGADAFRVAAEGFKGQNAGGPEPSARRREAMRRRREERSGASHIV